MTKKGQKMGIISNIDPRINGILKQAGIRHHFEFVIPSYEVKCRKPDSAIFNLALEKFSHKEINPSECCHIGDSYLEDFIGATESGWSGILIDELSKNNLDSKFCCKNINELNDRL